MNKPSSKVSVAKSKSTPTKSKVAKKAAARKVTTPKAALEKPAKTAASVKAPRLSAAPAVKIAKKSPAAQTDPSSVSTTIVAAIDVGFGNQLTLRGAGPGLTWERGVPMKCVADDRWAITLPEAAHPVVCKFLINDSIWCAGGDYTVLPGSSVVLSPVF